MGKSQTIHLQGIGKVAAQSAESFKIGDITVWNYGEQDLIVGIAKETPKTIVWRIRTKNGIEYTRRVFKERLVGIGSSKI